MKYIYHHLGLGDHIICNGLVREYSKQFSEIIIFCKQHNYESVSFMFSDLKNLRILIGDDNYVLNYLRTIPEQNIIRIGYTGYNWGNLNLNFERTFYFQAGLDFNKRWDSFKLIRDKNKEIQLFNVFGFKEKEYIFVHQDKERNFLIDNKYLKNKKIIFMEKGLTLNIFDYLYLIENATEVHVIESCLAFIIDSLQLQEDKNLFIHRYSRKIPLFEIPTYKKNWNIINEI
jgi:hypothetical protein